MDTPMIGTKKKSGSGKLEALVIIIYKYPIDKISLRNVEYAFMIIIITNENI